MKNLKLNCLALAGLTAIMGGLCACDGGHSSSSITTVNIVLFNGTGGKEWVTNATKRFAEANKETSFEEGKKGINFKITQKKNVIFNTELKSSGDDIFIYESTVDPYQLSAQNFLLDLSDVVAPIEDKIEDNIKERCKGVDGKYYALPHYEWFPGLSYDKDLFNEKNFYFADPSVDAEDKDLYQSKYGDAYLSPIKPSKNLLAQTVFVETMTMDFHLLYKNSIFFAARCSAMAFPQYYFQAADTIILGTSLSHYGHH